MYLVKYSDVLMSMCYMYLLSIDVYFRFKIVKKNVKCVNVYYDTMDIRIMEVKCDILILNILY